MKHLNFAVLLPDCPDWLANRLDNVMTAAVLVGLRPLVQ
jgi:hypothetical protein